MERLSGETVAGAALTFLSILFIYAGSVNPIWAIALPADYIILAIGIGLIALGVISTQRKNRMHPHSEEHAHY